MSDRPNTVGKMSGITSFADDEEDYIAPPSREVRSHAKAQGETLGFISDKPPMDENAIAASSPGRKAPDRKKRTRLPSQYPDHYNLRLRDGDRERFDEYAYRHRMPKGEVFRVMLDLLEAQEGNQSTSE